MFFILYTWPVHSVDVYLWLCMHVGYYIITLYYGKREMYNYIELCTIYPMVFTSLYLEQYVLIALISYLCAIFTAIQTKFYCSTYNGSYMKCVCSEDDAYFRYFGDKK